MKEGKSGCQNPHCYNRNGALKVQCKHKCGFVLYCSENCQRQHWLTGHQFDCPLQSSFTPNNILSQREWQLFEKTPFVKQGKILPVDARQPLKKLTLADFEAIQPSKPSPQMAGLPKLPGKHTFLGQGSYGSVELVRYKRTGEQFAMKRLEKSSLAKLQRRSLLEQVEIHKRLVHDNIIRLYHSFEDETYIYLILEYAKGGTLFHLIRRRKQLSEDDAFYYFIQACSGIYFLHENNMIHRDIKPENLLIDADDKLKLCDFGWCVVNNDTSTRSTYCGTLEYMAPEMLHGGEHNHTLDLWAMGVLLYELLHGHAPFTGRVQLEIKRKIMKREISFRAGLSSDVKELIADLLQHEAKHRLPLMKVLIHPWVLKMSKKFHLIEPEQLEPKPMPRENIADFYELPPRVSQQNNNNHDSEDLMLLRDMKKKEPVKKKDTNVLPKMVGPLAEILEEELKSPQLSTSAASGMKEDEMVIGMLQEAIKEDQSDKNGGPKELEKMCHDMLDQMHIFEQIRKSRKDSLKPPMANRSNSRSRSPLPPQPDDLPPKPEPELISQYSEEMYRKPNKSLEFDEEELQDNQPDLGWRPQINLKSEIEQATKRPTTNGESRTSRRQNGKAASEKRVIDRLNTLATDRGMHKPQKSMEKQKTSKADLSFDMFNLELDLSCQRERRAEPERGSEEEKQSRQMSALEKLRYDFKSKEEEVKMHNLYEDEGYRAKWLDKREAETHMPQDHLPRKFIYGHRDYEASAKGMLEAIEGAQENLFKNDLSHLPPEEQFRLRNQKKDDGNFWEKLWQKMSNPFGCGSTSRKADISAK